MGAMDPYIFVSFELKIFFCKAHTGVTLANVRTHVTRRKREITNKSQFRSKHAHWKQNDLSLRGLILYI